MTHSPNERAALADRFANALVWQDDDDPDGFVAVDISLKERDLIVAALRADPSMTNALYRIRDLLSYEMPIDDFIWSLKAAVQIDSRTMLGGDIQRCLLSNAAHRLEILQKQIDPDAIWRARGWPRLKDAWAVFRGRAVVTYVTPPDSTVTP